MYFADLVWQEEEQGIMGYKNAGMALIFVTYCAENLEKSTEIGLVPPSQIAEKIDIFFFFVFGCFLHSETSKVSTSRKF